MSNARRHNLHYLLPMIVLCVGLIICTGLAHLTVRNYLTAMAALSTFNICVVNISPYVEDGLVRVEMKASNPGSTHIKVKDLMVNLYLNGSLLGSVFRPNLSLIGSGESQIFDLMFTAISGTRSYEAVVSGLASTQQWQCRLEYSMVLPAWDYRVPKKTVLDFN